MRVSELAGRVGNSGCGGGRDVARRGGFAPPARRGYGAAVRGGGCEASRSAELAEEKDSGPAEHGERLPHLLCVVLANSDILTANYGVK